MAAVVGPTASERKRKGRKKGTSEPQGCLSFHAFLLEKEEKEKKKKREKGRGRSPSRPLKEGTHSFPNVLRFLEKKRKGKERGGGGGDSKRSARCRAHCRHAFSSLEGRKGKRKKEIARMRRPLGFFLIKEEKKGEERERASCRFVCLR